MSDRTESPLLVPLVRLLRTATISLLALVAVTACTSTNGDATLDPSVEPSPDAAERAASTPDGSPITIAAVGDLMLARDVAIQMETEGPLYPFELVLPLFTGADLQIGNLEGTFTDRGEPLDKLYTFRTPPSLAEGLARAGFDAVSIANNHSFDFGRVGLSDTLDALDAVGVSAVGGGLDEVSAYAPVVFRQQGRTVAILGFDSIGETQAARGEQPGVAWADQAALDAINLASRSSDHVIVMVHAGVEYSRTPTEEQSAFARAAIDAGADVVIGHHPHALQPWEFHGDGLILNSLGNFVFDLDADDLEELGPAPFESVVALITLTPGQRPELELRPVYIDVNENRPRPATPSEVVDIERALGGLGTGAQQ